MRSLRRIFAAVILVFLALTPLLLLGDDKKVSPDQVFGQKLLKMDKSSFGSLRLAEDEFPNYDLEFTPPDGVKPFKLSQDYPPDYNPDEKFPWAEINFKENPKDYLREVLQYCLKGNVEVSFQGQLNETRKWYHAPWMDNDGAKKEEGKRKGREFHHGLTRERHSADKDLHPLQVQVQMKNEPPVQNWAVSLYNERGGYTLRRIWKTATGLPEPNNATFPDHTVSFKLLFTNADLEKVPFIQDSYEWTANINPDPMKAPKPFNRVDQNVRLLQVDIAVKDPRVAGTTGWVFGTFIYDKSNPGKSAFERLVPVGLSWGDDGKNESMIKKTGSFINEELKDSWLNKDLIQQDGKDWGKKAYVTHHGLGGRLNGPVDNPASSCISCHARAGAYSRPLPPSLWSGYPMPILAGKGMDFGKPTEQIAAFGDMFRLIRGNAHLELAPVAEENGVKKTFVTVDYSLQVSQGIRNFYQAFRTDTKALKSLSAIDEFTKDIVEKGAPKLRALPEVSRGD